MEFRYTIAILAGYEELLNNVSTMLVYASGYAYLY